MRTSAVPIIFSANLRISLMARGARFLKPLQVQHHIASCSEQNIKQKLSYCTEYVHCPPKTIYCQNNSLSYISVIDSKGPVNSVNLTQFVPKAV